MKFIRTKDTTLSLGAPAGWDAEKYGPCETLHVARENGIFYSFWKPSFADKIRLIFGWSVQLSVVSDRHPPVCLILSPAKEVK